MNPFTAILEPAADGTLHLPVPAEWRHWRIKVEAEPAMAPSTDPNDLKGFGCLKGRIATTPDFSEPLAGFKDYMARSCCSTPMP